MTSKTYWVPESNILELTSKLEKLVKKSAKLGLEPITYTIGNYQDVEFKQTHQGGVEVKHFVRKYEVAVSGSTPRLTGWSFVATLTHLEVEGETANILKTIPSFEDALPAQFRTASPENCDHCNKKIRTRKETFIVRHDDGTWKQVGRNCTQDFLGGCDPHGVAKYLECLFSALDEAELSEGGGGSAVDGRFSILSFLACVAACIRVDGWRSRSAARAYNETSGGSRVTATADDALDLMFPPKPISEEYKAWAAERRPTLNDIEVANKAVEYAKKELVEELERRGVNDYLQNLWVAANQVAINHKLAGITASLISYWLREQEKLVLREREANLTANSKHVGVVKAKIVEQVTVLRHRTSIGNFGTTHVYSFATVDGNALTWFSSNEIEELKTGALVWLSGTVKEHGEYKGLKQTVVTRCSVISEEKALDLKRKAAKKQVKAALAEAKLAELKDRDW